MRKAIRTLEAPLYLLVIAMCIYEIEQTIAIPLVLVLISVARLIANTMFDEFIYKR
tara:strand:+ start:182 stop:349 length:168 start_codon:yes stop_codon:yes gene_type:complete